MKNTNRQGFTLVEMSIVIVIIGLILAGIVVGQSVVRNSKVALLLAEEAKFKTAIASFKLKYRSLPGDIEYAVDYWGGQTANGDGDGKICCATTAGGQPLEAFFMWNHLALAEMVHGAYGTVGATQPITGIHIPRAATSDNDGWWVLNSGSDYHGWNFGASPIYGKEGNMLGIGSGTGYDFIDGGVMTPDEAEALDIKVDDGIPNRGEVLIVKSGETGNGGGYVTGCVSHDPDAATADTNVTFTFSDTTRSCKPIFLFNE